jgi:hypothetical protein
MIEILNMHEDLLRKKIELQKCQNKFKEVQQNTYPALCQDYKGLKENLDKEFEIALSSCLKFKTSRIQLRAEKKGNDYFPKHLFLTRSPGLKQAYSSSSTIKISELSSFKDRVLSQENGYEKGSVDLKQIEKHPHIDIVQLQKIYAVIEKIVKVNTNARNLLDKEEYWGDKPSNPKMVGKDIQISIRKKHFTICCRELNWKSEQMLSFEENGEVYNWKEKDRQAQVEIISQYSEVHKCLIKLEKSKKQLIRNTKDLINEFRKLSKVFRITQQLLAK